MGETKMANKIREAIQANRRKILTYGSNKIVDICPVCGNHESQKRRNKKGQTVCEATKVDCKTNSKV
jgi:hypothetical protein